MEPVFFQSLTNELNPSIHHIGRGDNIGTGLCVRKCGFGEEFTGSIVINLVVFYDSAMSVRGVCTKADVGNYKQFGARFFDLPYRVLNDAIFGPGFRAFFVLFLGEPKSSTAGMPREATSAASWAIVSGEK